MTFLNTEILNEEKADSLLLNMKLNSQVGVNEVLMSESFTQIICSKLLKHSGMQFIKISKYLYCVLLGQSQQFCSSFVSNYFHSEKLTALFLKCLKVP